MGEPHRLLSSVMMIEPELLPADSTPLRDIEGWDSLKHVQLVVGLEQRLNSKLTAEEIQGIVTVNDVARVMKEKGINA